MKFTKLFTTYVLFLSLASASLFAADYKHNVSAINGYDAVSYQTGKKPLRGNGNYTSDYDGVTYLFASNANNKLFDSNPEKYVPAYGGYCAFGVSVGKKFAGDPEVWRVVDGRLYLNLDTGIQDQWLKDVPGRISKADKKWARIKDISPTEL